jgi:hypothetical protein
MTAAGHSSRQCEKAEDVRLRVDTIPGLVWSTQADGSAEFFNQRCHQPIKLNYNRLIHVVGGCTRIGGSSDQPTLANKGDLR